jgi:GDP-L-fucose synthase
MDLSNRIFVAGSTGMVGSALVRKLRAEGYSRLLLPTHKELELTDNTATLAYFQRERPEYVFMAAARVGGIFDNISHPVEMLRTNTMIALSVFSAAWQAGVTRICNFGSSCIYPRESIQPITENALHTGALEHTNKPYAIAKIAAITFLESLRDEYGVHSVTMMPTNIYGQGDNYNPEQGHVIPELVRRFITARDEGDTEVVVFGTGTPLREFLYVDDLASAAVLAMQSEHEGILNVGSGVEVSISELAKIISSLTDFRGLIVFDPSKPDGTPRKLLDSRKIRALGWSPNVQLKDGIILSITEYMMNWRKTQ